MAASLNKEGDGPMRIEGVGPGAPVVASVSSSLAPVAELLGLTSGQPYQVCDPALFPFETTAELQGLSELVGQMRALEAVRFGVVIRHEGYARNFQGSQRATGRAAIGFATKIARLICLLVDVENNIKRMIHVNK